MKSKYTRWGYEYTLRNKSLTLLNIAMLKEGIKFTDQDIINTLKAQNDFYNSIFNKSGSILTGALNLEAINVDPSDQVLYKFVSTETYEKYIRNGKFQLGSLKYYREIERDESRDEKEGFSSLLLSTPQRDILTTAISGNNHYIFCGTNTLDNKDYMAKNFGGYLLKIYDIKSFANKIKNSIGARRWHLKKVYYSDFKFFRFNTEIKDLSKVNPDLSEEIFECIHTASTLPSIFYKPLKFSNENELRLTFEFDKDITKRTLTIENKKLLLDFHVEKL